MSKSNTKSFRERALKKSGPKPRVNSKVKGNRNELEVAKAISQWTGVEFRRTPMSGAIHVPLHWLAGDIFCTDQSFNFPWAVEAKHYHKLTPKMRTDFWDQACNDAERINKKPMLIVREDGWPAGTWRIRLAISGWAVEALGIGWDMPKDNKAGLIVNSTDLFSVPYEKLLKWI